MNQFSIGEVFKSGLETFKTRAWFFVGVTLIIAIVSGVASQMTHALNQDQEMNFLVFRIVIAFFGLLVSIWLKMGSINFFIRAHDNTNAVEIKDLWAPHPFWNYVIAGIAVGIIVVVGFILLIIPGIMWALRFMFVPYLIMDRRLDISAALRESSRMTYGHKWQLLLFALSIVGLNILGAICLVVGLLVTIPVSSLAFIHVYRKLGAAAHGGDL